MSSSQSSSHGRKRNKTISSNTKPTTNITTIRNTSPSRELDCALCSSCSQHNLSQELFKPYGSTTYSLSEPSYTFENPNFWLSASHCRFCNLAFKAFQRNGFVEFCTRKPPGVILRVFLQAFAPLGLVFNPNTDVVRRINICLYIKDDSQSKEPQTLDDIDGDIEPYQHLDDKFPSLDLQVIGDPKHGRFRLGRVCDPEHADIKLLRSWLTICDRDHGNLCKPRLWSDGNDDNNDDFYLRLIDVKRRCIVNAPAECEYLTLSYTWGDTTLLKHLKLTQALKGFFEKDGALADDNLDVPRTIRDAMQLTEDLGESLLWVDAMCIIQDEPDDLKAQCANMDRIYASAKLTIVAGYGQHAWAGLPGVGRMPLARTGRQIKTTIDHSLTIATALRGYESWRVASAWNTRAWTYQEQICSRRLLILTGQQAFFHCETSLWYEDTALENSRCQITQLAKFDKTSSVLIQEPWSAYCEIARKFSARKIGHQGDMLRAFRGLENYLAPSLACAFVFGLPESDFDAAISWLRFCKEPPLRITAFPTWSWLGWKFASENLKIPRRAKVWRVATFRAFSEDLQTYKTIESRIKPCSLYNLPVDPPPESAFSVDNLVPTAHLLQIWTSAATLRVDRTGTKLVDAKEQADLAQHATYTIRDDEGNYIGMITLDEAWRLSQPDCLEFCALSGSSDGEDVEDGRGPSKFNVLLISYPSWSSTRGDGLQSHRNLYATRSRLLSFSLCDWLRSKPVWKWITLA